MLGIVDYNMGNLASVLNACKLLKIEAQVESDPTKLNEYDRIILPGVGAFGDAMEHLKQSGMQDAILNFAKTNKPILGICLGMQLLFESSTEFGKHKGLGLIDGQIIKFDKSQMHEDTKVPHVGWNTITTSNEHTLFEGLENPYLYFVHSYHVLTNPKNVIGKTTYGYEFVSAVHKNNIYGFQPHPEKSHDNGLKILKNFIQL